MTKILNLARLNKKLRRLPEVARTKIRGAMEDMAGEVVSLAKKLVAVDDGALRDSIGWTWGTAPKGSITLGRVRGGEMTITIYAGNSDAFYARWVEFGTSPHKNGGLFDGTDHPGTSAQPFFYPSWRANKKLVRREVRKAARQAARQVARS